jgi:SSS family solute:Na+ symporter
MFAAFFWPRANGAGAVAGLLIGIAVNTLFLVAPELKPFPLHEGVYGVLANVLALSSVSLLTAPEPAARVRTYVNAGAPLDTESPA